jgi:Replication-relaxation
MLRCTERDKKLIVKCGLCRWLTTTQIQRLYFPQATVNAVQKRLRKLTEAGYLRTHREGMLSEALHTAGPKGKVIFEEKGLEYTGGVEVSRQIAHMVGVNDIRIAVETGAIPVAYFFAHWQVAHLGWMHPVIPDATFALVLPCRRTFAVEYDRATESLSVLVAKLCAYQEGLRGFPVEAVLIITERDRRMESLSREIRKRDLSLRVLMASLAELQTKSVVDCSFLDLSDGGHRKILDTQSA